MRPCYTKAYHLQIIIKYEVLLHCHSSKPYLRAFPFALRRLSYIHTSIGGEIFFNEPPIPNKAMLSWHVQNKRNGAKLALLNHRIA